MKRKFVARPIYCPGCYAEGKMFQLDKVGYPTHAGYKHGWSVAEAWEKLKEFESGGLLAQATAAVNSGHKEGSKVLLMRAVHAMMAERDALEQQIEMVQRLMAQMSALEGEREKGQKALNAGAS